MRVIFGVGYHTATDVHHHRAQALREHRADVLLDAYLDYPERFVRKIPAPPELPTAAWINPPHHQTQKKKISSEVMEPRGPRGSGQRQAITSPGTTNHRSFCPRTVDTYRRRRPGS